MSLLSHRSLWILLASIAVSATGCKKAEIPTSAPNPTGLRKERGYRVRAEPPATPEQIATYNLLDEDKQKFKEAMDGLTPTSQPPDFTSRFKNYVGYLDTKTTEDLAPLPPDVKTNFVRYRTGCKKFLKQVGFRPAGDGTEFMTAMNELYGGKTEKLVEVYGKDFMDAFREMRQGYVVLLAAGESAGLEYYD